jgi:putative endonuclease
MTNDIDRRVREHREGKRGAKFFRTSPPADVVYREQCHSRSTAAVREAEIKRMRREAKLELIQRAARSDTSR